MKKHIIFSAIAVLIVLAACQNDKPKEPRQYVYQETLRSINNKVVLLGTEPAEDLFLRVPDTIMAVNDIDAFEQAYGQFCASILFYAMLNDENSEKTIGPLKFTLTNSAGNDIASNLPANKEEIENRIWKSHIDLETKYAADSAKLKKIESAVQIRY